MKIKALTSFSGALTMAKGEVLDYSDTAVIQDLLQAGYIEKVTAPKGSAKNESKRVKSG